MSKKTIKEDPDYEIVWWKDWLEGDVLERHDMVEKLPFTKSVVGLSKTKMPKKMLYHSIATMLNGFFEDLEGAIHTRQRLEKEK